MAQSTKISWAGASWNPWVGCHKVSPACAHCYAERWCKRTGRDFNEVSRTSERTFHSPLRWKEPKLIFVCSLSDFFIEEADGWRDEAWAIMAEAPQHVYLLLTKRPERIKACLPADWPRPSVWLGATVESDDYIPRLDYLLDVPAAGYFVSCEPLLEAIDPWLLSSYFARYDYRPTYEFYRSFYKGVYGVELEDEPIMTQAGISCAIVGGESGVGYREMNMDWVRDIRDVCIEENVCFHFKQKSGFRPGFDPTVDGEEWKQVPDAWKVGQGA